MIVYLLIINKQKYAIEYINMLAAYESYVWDEMKHVELVKLRVPFVGTNGPRSLLMPINSTQIC